LIKNKKKKIETPIAKTTWVKTKQVWKIFWMRADLIWYSYTPVPEVKNLSEFTRIVDEDKYHCFRG
jgi:hypothetical protein